MTPYKEEEEPAHSLGLWLEHNLEPGPSLVPGDPTSSSGFFSHQHAYGIHTDKLAIHIDKNVKLW